MGVLTVSRVKLFVNGVEVCGYEESREVVYADAHKASVIKFLPDGKVRIKFNDVNLVPPEMDVPEESLREAWTGNLVVNPHKKCPNCGIAWQEVMLARFPCYDCPSCGAKKEDYVGSADS